MNDFRLSKDVRPSRYELRFDLDLDAWRSAGTARIELRTDRASHEIVLHAVDLDIGSARLDGEPAMHVSYDDDSQTATIEFASEAAAGEHVLELEWQGEIRASMRGLYRSLRGEERYAATQFEAADARRAFPSFDEPEFKARFRLELVHPAELAALANAPIEHAEDLGAGRRLTRFAEMPRISSYLLAFTVGPYEATPEASTSTGVPVRVWVPPGLAEQGVYARDAHVRCLEWLEGYTAIPYAYTKVDAIGIPDFEAGAMENPGAITYRARYLAADRRTASTATLKIVFAVAAHELTHMWWGDLVTMAWWDDLWLNESFASFVGDKATTALNPEWGYERDVVGETLSAFNLDSLATTHAISMEVRNVDQATERFDAVTYEKGHAALRMIEGYVGHAAFRDGVRTYLARHGEANATADDFWRALDEATELDVTALAHAWIGEPGHPVVSCEVVETGGGLDLTLRQERFYADPDLPAGEQVWPVPMAIAYGADGLREQRVLMNERVATVRLPGARWYFPNGGATGFYRYALDDRSVELLAPAVRDLRPTERLDLVSDTWALVRARRASVAQLIELVRALGAERDRAVLQTLSELLGWISEQAVAEATRPAFQRFVASIYRPELETLGWDVRPDDSFDERQKRVVALAALGEQAEDPEVRAEARRRIEGHLAGTARLDPDLATVLAAIAANDGDRALFDRYVARMKESEKADTQEEARFRNALAHFREPAVVDRAVQLAFSDAIRDQDRFILVPLMLGLRHARQAAWEVMRATWDQRIAPMDPGAKRYMVVGVSQLTPRELAAAATTFLRAHVSDDVKETVAQAIERLRLLSATAECIAAELPAALDRVTERARAV